MFPLIFSESTLKITTTCQSYGFKNLKQRIKARLTADEKFKIRLVPRGDVAGTLKILAKIAITNTKI